MMMTAQLEPSLRFAFAALQSTTMESVPVISSVEGFKTKKILVESFANEFEETWPGGSKKIRFTFSIPPDFQGYPLSAVLKDLRKALDLISSLRIRANAKSLTCSSQ